MASKGNNLQANLSVPLDIRRKKISGQEKREALEREVSALQKMLKQEEKVHEILELLQKKNEGSGFSIPNFLPPKAKELLAELAMTESEIIRLEAQISQLKLGLRREQEIMKETKSKQWQPRNTDNLQSHFWSTMPSPLHRGVQEKMGFETKALHFISKAIKGDYIANDFTLNDKTGSSKVEFPHHKEHQFHEEVSKFQDRIPKKSGLLKSPSPLRDLRHPSPKLRERQVEFATDLLPKSLSNAILSEENNAQQFQPNKLSENIMKCLNFIYVRLLRTSRAMELEKSGPISRSLQASLSFRTDTSSNSKTNLMLQRESRQQDPYGIFNSEESIPRDIGPYKNLVIFTSSSMDPKCISSSSSIPLLRRLRVLMDNLETVDLRFLTYHQKLAFWINMYNACIMHGFIQYGVPSTPEKLLTLMNKATLNVGGNTINAQAIEQYILRKATSSNKKSETDDKEAIVRKLCGLELMDPNVTFALCCGTRSSPAVRVYTGDGVIAELEKSKLEYLQASIIVTSTKRIAFPELLLRNMLDFAPDTNSLVEWVCHQLPTSGSLRKSIVDCFRSHNSGKVTSISVEKIPYDFEFQYLLAI
ncbi:electron transporter, putative [Ricinus communis]|uniref:Electron transporter, putative n=1 Tax=Ricinus communis TaxID=3988 RepID=B9STW6_RICCO|nr:electron transporter, putative [Ricinus communis]